MSMPSATDIEKRDRALIALALMTGARDDALASMRLKHIDLVGGLVYQDAREVRTKFSKTFPTLRLALDIGLTSLALGIERVKLEVEIMLTRLAGIDRTALGIGNNRLPCPAPHHQASDPHERRYHLAVVWRWPGGTCCWRFAIPTCKQRSEKLRNFLPLRD
jgi:integrase